MEKTTKKKAPAKKPATKAHKAEKPKTASAKAKPEKAKEASDAKTEVATVKAEKAGHKGRYIFATGRRKTSVANVRMFQGDEESLVNKKSFEKYFFTKSLQEAVTQPLELSGLAKTYYFYANVSGGGINSQSEALAHAIAKSLSSLGDDVKKVLKKNGLLTRDDRKKERKKPGLKRARRSPQWAKR